MILSIKVSKEEINMRQSRIVAITGATVLSIGLAGCFGGGSSGAQETVVRTAENPCPVPISAKQPVTFSAQNDFESVKGVLSTSIININLGFYLSILTMKTKYLALSNIEEDNSLEGRIAKKVKNVQENALSVLESGAPIETGNNIQCDNYSDVNQTGFYNATYTASDDGYDLSLEFKNCLLHESDDDQIEDLWDLILYNSPLVRLEDLSETTENTSLFNGKFTMSFHKTSESNEMDAEDSNRTRSLHIDKENLSLEYARGNGEKLFEYQGNGTLDMQANNHSEHRYNKIYDSDDNTSYTEIWDNKDTLSIHLSMDMDEKLHDYDDNHSSEMQALCYAVETREADHNIERTHYNSEGDSDSEEYNNSHTWHIENNGYIALRSSDENFFADTYANQYVYDGAWIRSRSNDGDESDVSTVSLNGTVGSSLVGGSAQLDTTTPWKWSLDESAGFSNNSYVRDIFDLQHMTMPDEGRTIFTGTNSAVVSFQHNENNETNGTITVGGESETYDNMDDMFIDLIDG